MRPPAHILPSELEGLKDMGMGTRLSLQAHFTNRASACVSWIFTGADDHALCAIGGAPVASFILPQIQEHETK